MARPKPRLAVDPERDSPAALKAFLRAYPRFTGLTGSAEQVEDAKRAVRIFTRRRDAPDGYDVQHTAITYLLDPEGRPTHHWPDTHDAPRIAADLVRLLE